MISYDKKKLAILKENYFEAKALLETIKEGTEEIQKKILEINEFYESETWTERMETRGGNGKRKRIKKPFDAYLMTDEDFQNYVNLCYEQYKEVGIEDERGKNYLPEAKWQELLRRTEDKLLEYGIDIIPDKMKEKEILKREIKNYKHREKILDLVLKLEC